MGWRMVDGRRIAGVLTIVALVFVGGQLVVSPALAYDGANDDIDELAEGAIEAIEGREEAYDDFLDEEPPVADAEAELQRAIADVEAIALQAELSITAVMLLYPLDGGVQSQGTSAIAEVQDAARSAETRMAAAFAAYSAGAVTTTLPPVTTTTTTVVVTAPTTTTTMLVTTLPTLPTTTTTSPPVSSASTSTTVTAPPATSPPPSTTIAGSVGSSATTSASTTTIPTPPDEVGAAPLERDESSSPEPEIGGAAPSDVTNRAEGADLLELAVELPNPASFDAAPESQLVAGESGVERFLGLVRVRLPVAVAATLGGVGMILGAFVLAFASGLKLVAIPAGVLIALGLVRAMNSRVRSVDPVDVAL